MSPAHVPDSSETTGLRLNIQGILTSWLSLAPIITTGTMYAVSVFPALCSGILCVTSLILRGRKCHHPYLTLEKAKTQVTSSGTTEPANGRHGIQTQLCAAPEDRL